MQGRSGARREFEGVGQGGVAVELARADRPVDARQLLEDDAAGAETQVADLGVADHSRRQAHRLTGGLQESRRIGAPEPLHEARAAGGDGVALGPLAVAPAVQDDEDRGKRDGHPRTDS